MLLAGLVESWSLVLKRLNQQRQCASVQCPQCAGSPPVEQMVTIVPGGDQGGTGYWTLWNAEFCAPRTRGHQCLDI